MSESHVCVLEVPNTPPMFSDLPSGITGLSIVILMTKSYDSERIYKARSAKRKDVQVMPRGSQAQFPVA